MSTSTSSFDSPLSRSRRSSGSVDVDLERSIIKEKECAMYCESSNPDAELIRVCINKHYMHAECITDLLTKCITKACPMCRDDTILKKLQGIGSLNTPENETMEHIITITRDNTRGIDCHCGEPTPGGSKCNCKCIIFTIAMIIIFIWLGTLVS